MAAWIEGKPASLPAAIAEAARVLVSARLPVIAGLGTDVAGARAAVQLAARLGAVLDHMDADALLRDIDIMRESGLMITTLNEARLRADVMLLIGDVAKSQPGLVARLTGGRAARGRTLSHTIWLCPPRKPRFGNEDRPPFESLGRDPAELPSLMALLRSRVVGRPVAAASRQVKAVDQIAAKLKAARFGVAVWSAAVLDPLTIEMLCGLVNDLNDKTRFTGLPLAPSDNARGVVETCTWLSGVPVRTAFARGRAEHDPWRFDSVRAVDSGEADCALWVSAYRPAPPPWTRDLPMIALTARDTPIRHVPRVLIEVGRPGIDHDAVEYIPAVSTFAPVDATNPSDAPSVMRVLTAIASSLPTTGSIAC